MGGWSNPKCFGFDLSVGLQISRKIYVQKDKRATMYKKCVPIPECKLEETFRISSECETAVYFNWWLPVQFSVMASLYSWQTKSLQLATETEEYQMRLSLLP